MSNKHTRIKHSEAHILLSFGAPGTRMRRGPSSTLRARRQVILILVTEEMSHRMLPAREHLFKDNLVARTRGRPTHMLADPFAECLELAAQRPCMDLLYEPADALHIGAQESAGALVGLKGGLPREANRWNAEANRIGETLPWIVPIHLFIPRDSHAEPVKEAADLSRAPCDQAVTECVPAPFGLGFCFDTMGCQLVPYA